MLGSTLAAVVASIGACLACAGCASRTGVRFDPMGIPTNKAITRLELSARPEAQLRYPGSPEVKPIGSNEVATRDSEPDPAYTGAILTTTATAAQLYAWYAVWLTAHGYHQVTHYRMSDQTFGVAWRAPGGREQVQIGIFDATELAAQQHISVAAGTGTVVYEHVLVGYRVNTH
jgi:hypothetical protein